MMTTSTNRRRALWAGMAVTAALLAPRPAASQSTFKIEEATIAGIQQAIKAGQTTCRQVVEAYIERARAYNGICTALVTADGKPIAPAKGAVRAGAPITFPTQTVAVSTIFPSFTEYAGLPLELGRMEPTLSDPGRPAAVGHARRHPQRGAAERARDAQHPRRALGHLQGRLRPRAVGGAAAGGRAGRVRGVPQAARRARARRRARHAVRPQSRPGEDADVLRRVLVQELVRREGHARHRRQRRQLRDGRAEGRLAGRRRAARPRARSSTPSRPRTTSAAHRRRPGRRSRRRTCPSAT